MAELLEDRRVLATYVVTTVADSGAGSLRQAIIDANTTSGAADTITFNIGSGPKSIAPLTELPPITDTLTIDATSQPGFTGSPLIELRGDSLPAAGTDRGLFVQANNTQIRGLVINRFYVGIEVNGATGTVIAGNWIGVDSTGNSAAANRNTGISLLSTTGNTIGGTTVDARNVISGTSIGVFINGALTSNNHVLGNFIGTNAAGDGAIANSTGVLIGGGASNNTIGGIGTSARNLISGNTQFGISVQDVGTANNSILGNRIGTNSTGTLAVPNRFGVFVNVGASNTTIGGPAAGAGNLISGNTESGIQQNVSTTGTVVQGNFIGTDVTGTASLDNGGDGILAAGPILIGGLTTTPGTGAGNVISSNGSSPTNGGGNIRVGGAGVIVQGNIIGLDKTGANVIRQATQYGIWSLDSTAINIGGTTRTARNVISGNGLGVLLQGGSGHLVQNNYIGSDISGSLDKGNSNYGITTDALNAVLRGNLISGNDGAGLIVSGSAPAPTNLQVMGNTIGLNAAGTAKLGNVLGIDINGADQITIGGTTPNDRNLIGGNDTNGITIRGGTVTTNIKVQGNYVGLGADGNSVLGNAAYGVYVYDGVAGTVIGGTAAAAGNVISGNGANGLLLNGSSGNLVYGNYIGTDATGLIPRGNTGAGVEIIDSPNNRIGGGAVGQGNVVGANHVSVIGASSGTRIQGNIIGADKNGSVPLSNTYNVALAATSGVFIGTDSDGSNDATEGNVIAITSSAGVAVFGSNGVADGNVIAGNLVGTAKSGNALLTNFPGRGIWVASATNTRIGGLSSSERNVINSSGGDGGILLTDSYDTGTTGTLVQGNYIGFATNGSTILSTNSGLGIYFTPDGGQNVSNNTIGGTAVGSANLIGGWGTSINLNGAAVKNNSIVGNFIGYSSDAISLGGGAANNSISANSIGINAAGSATPNAIGIHVIATAGINPINDNLVRYSTGDNILVEAPSTVLRRNVSADSSGLPIRLNPSTLSPGTITITQVVSGISPLVLGEVRAKPSTAYTIDIFSSPIAGQASNYVTSSTVTTDATGFAAFSIASMAGKLNGYVTATLTGLGTSGNTSTSSLSPGILATPAIILGLSSQSPEGTPITLTAFASSNPVTGYLWQVNKDGAPYTYELRNDGTQSEGGIQFTPDNQGIYTVSLRVTLNDGTQFLLGPFTINVYNVAPTPSFEYAPSSLSALSPVTLTSNNSDPGKLDVLKTSWAVRTGSATGPIVYSTTPSTSTTASFTPAGGDLYFVTMTVDDGDGGVRTLTRAIDVAGLPVAAEIVVPQPTAVEGQKVRARAAESLLNRTETLSFVWTLTKTPAGSNSVPTAYPFTVPSPGVIEFLPNDDGVYTIGLTVFKAGTTTGGVIAPPQIVMVSNASPRVSIVRTPIDSASSQATLNTPLSLSATVTDPGTADTQTIVWSVKQDNQVLPITGSGPSFSFTPNAAGIYEVSAQVTDDDFAQTNPVGRSVGSRAFTVAGPAVAVAIVPPSGTNPSNVLAEGTSYTFTSSVNSGVSSYAWKARTTEGVPVASASTSSFTFTPAQGGRYQIELQVTLADGNTASAIYGPITVAGTAPTISSLSVVSPTATPIFEGTEVTVRTVAVDARDSIGLSYRWELQKPGGASYTDVPSVDGSPIDLKFTPEDEGIYSVRVSVSDSQGLITTRVLSITILNANPVARINATYLSTSPSQLTFSAVTSDPGSTDTLSYEWSVNGGAFLAPSSSNQFVTPLAGLNNIKVRVTDNDGGSVTTSYYVVRGTAGNDTYTITASDVAASGTADQILYLALDGDDNITIAGNVTKKVTVLGGAGNDTINASAATINVLLDGGEGNDTLTGGSGDDVLIAGIGTNVLVGGDGKNRFIGGGSDTMTGGRNADYYEVHFSNVVLNDLTSNVDGLGGYDTVDLTAAQAGVSLNFSNNAGQPQTVFPGSTLALNGNFERLIGSTYNDALSTSTPGTTLEGGLGDDQLTSNAAGTALDGGGGNDTIQLNSAAGTFNGGGGNDTITGTLQSSATTTVSTGDGSDVVNIVGESAAALAPVTVSVGGGINAITASKVTGKIYGNNGAETNAVNAYGTAASSVTSIAVSNSGTVGIYGSASLGSTITVVNSTNVGIYGTGAITLDKITNSTLTSTLYGAALSIPTATTATVTSSTNVGIYGSAALGGPSLNGTITNSTNVGIYGSATPAGSITVTGGGAIGIYGVSGGSIDLTGVSAGINIVEMSAYGSAALANTSVAIALNSSTNVGIYGSAAAVSPTINATITNSTNVGIYGSATKASTITVTGGGDIGIFGLVSGSVDLTDVTRATIKATEYGSAVTPSTSVSITASNSSNVGIYGSASSLGPSLTAAVTNSTNVGIYGAASQGVSSIAVTNSGSVGIYGSAVLGGSTLSVTVTNSTTVGIYGSARPGDQITVTGGGNVGIYEMLAGDVSLTAVSNAIVHLSDYGSATPAAVSVATSNSQNVGIYGSAALAGPTLTASVTNSTNVGIYGSAASANTITVAGGIDIGIYSAYSDNITIIGAQRVTVQGGVYGAAVGNQGITVSVSGGSTNVGIFGTELVDNVRVGASTVVGLNLGGGDDLLTIDGAAQLVAIADKGSDFVSVRSGSDMLIYLGEGNDRAEVLDGSNIRIIGEAGDDQFSISGGSNIQNDGGNDNDQMYVTGGQSIVLRGDAGNDIADIYAGIGMSVSGGAGNDRFRVFGSLGGALDAGLVYALLDGQEGDDTLEVRPLLSVSDRGQAAIAIANPGLSIPSWITVPAWISTPTVSTYASSIAIVGGLGADSLWVDGADRIYALAGDDNDTVTLQSGNNCEVSGGLGSDNIVVNANGADNRIFGDQDNDTIRANAGVRLGIFGEEGADNISFYGGVDSFARGGGDIDTMDLNSGTRVTLVGETGNDVITIRGGTDGIAAGSSGDDQLEITGGDRGLLLGQSGNDNLKDTSGTRSILSGGDGDDTINSVNRGSELYGDDGDDNYVALPATSTTLLVAQMLRLRELLYVDPSNFEPESRGSDTIDLSAFATSATLNLGTQGVYTSMTQGLQSVIAGQLQLILLGTLDNIVGTNDNDTLTGSPEPNRIQGMGGNDIISGLGGDDSLEGGAGDDTLIGGLGDDNYLFSTTAAASLGTDTIYELPSAGTDSLNFKGMPTGLGTLDLNLATSQVLAGGLLSLLIRQSSTSTLRGDIEEVVGTPFNDTILGNELDNRIEPSGGNDVVDGRGGSDIYVYSGRNLGNDQIIDASTGAGRDTLDFAGFDAPLQLDLSVTTPQNLGEATLSLSANDAIENVVGTSFDDVILGNARDNTLYGAAGIDRLEGRAGSDRLVADLPSIVLLDFDSAYRADRGDYNYSTAERNAIQQRLAAAYSAFNWTFTQSESQAQALTADMGRNFVRLAFSQGRGGDVSGDAGEVDFRNISRRLVSEVNINALLPTVRGLLLEQKGPNYTVQDYSNMVVALTSTIAAHELAHTAGLRHGDSFGPIGTGVYVGTDTSNVYPAYAGPTAASETGRHIMASPASVGTTIADAVLVPYFGEREAIKLAFDEIGRSQREANTIAGSHGSIVTAESLGSLSPLYVPNLAPASGFVRSGQSFRVSALAVIGDLTPFTSNGTTEHDYYKFSGKAGEYVNAELMADSLRPLRGDAFDGELRIYNSAGALLALNDDDFEGTKDATLMDIVLPADGDYYISVGLSTSPAILSPGGRYELFISRFAVGVNSSVPGDTLVGGSGPDILIGGAADDLFLADGSISTDIDTIDGRDGKDTLDKQGRVYNYNGTSVEVVLSTGANAPPTVAITWPVDGVAGQAIAFTFTATDTDSVDANGPFEFSINWGDGSSTVASTPAGQRSITINHTYISPSSAGTYAVSAVARDARALAGPAAVKDFAVTGFVVTTDPIHPGQSILVIVGTQGADTIVVRETCRDELSVRIRDRESSLRIRGRVDGDVERILVFALDGNDQVVIDEDVDVDAEIWGGNGNDYIEGGEGNDIVWGGAGDDLIFGGKGRDIMIGGTGADRIVGDDQDDILIGGLTAYDDEFNRQAPSAFTTSQRLTLNAQRLSLEAILAEWTSNRSYASRRNNVLGVANGTRSNANYFFKVSDSNLLANTVFDDGAQDRLWGSCGVDWYFANLDGDNRSAVDRVMDGETGETRTDIDRWF